MDDLFDIIIIGAGPAGLTAGLYASRAKMNTLLLEKMGCGGQSVITDWIENYPGFPEGISGFELASKMEEQAKKFGLLIELDEVTAIQKDNLTGELIVKTNGKLYKSLSVVLSCGTHHQALNIPGEKEFIGQGVSYCATCDGPFFKDKDVVVVGGGNSAVQEAIFLTKFAKSVTVVHRRNELRAVKVLKERAVSNPKIKFIWDSVVLGVEGNGHVEKIIIKNLKNEKIENIQTDGVFVFVGIIPNTAFLKGFINLDESGYIITDENFQTSVKGVFACGDARKKVLRQIVTAAGEGASAVFAAQEYAEDIKGTRYK